MVHNKLTRIIIWFLGALAPISERARSKNTRCKLTSKCCSAGRQNQPACYHSTVSVKQLGIDFSLNNKCEDGHARARLHAMRWPRASPQSVPRIPSGNEAACASKSSKAACFFFLLLVSKHMHVGLRYDVFKGH